MAQNNYPPVYLASAFQCPLCGVFAKQEWSNIFANGTTSCMNITFDVFRGHIDDYTVSKCGHCHEIAMWMNGQLIYPRQFAIAGPNEDLSDEIKHDYKEAATILQDSPRGAAALLRLCMQKLFIQLGLPGNDLNNDIKTLVKRGLSKDVEKAMDLLRITGNNAVHPGEINLNDTPDIANHLFELLNFVANEMITRPKEINELYENIIPPSKKESIKKRDGEK